MATTIKLIETDNAYEYEFTLMRKTGKNKTLAKGNQVLNANDRMHYIVKGQITEYLRELAFSLLQQKNNFQTPPFDSDNPCTVLVTVYPPTRRRIDPYNLAPTAKALMDGMTDAKLWTDDNKEIVKLVGFNDGGISGNKMYKIVLTISNYNGERKK
jgi:crossover junction endodeoxyribonuclease RusA